MRLAAAFVSMKNKWTLTPEAFNRLLASLSPNREEAGRKYEELRGKLIYFLTKRGCPEPEDLTDETVNEVAKKLEFGTLEYSGGPLPYFIGVAKNIYYAYLRRPRHEVIEEEYPGPAPLPDPELYLRCLEKCMATLSERNRKIVSRYHQDQGREKIRIRQLLADELGIGMNTLRIQVHRIVKTLRECFFGCIEKETAN
jgi:DNA-directed RNA polymerase specialized sigma24 family protein